MLVFGESESGNNLPADCFCPDGANGLAHNNRSLFQDLGTLSHLRRHLGLVGDPSGLHRTGLPLDYCYYSLPAHSDPWSSNLLLSKADGHHAGCVPLLNRPRQSVEESWVDGDSRQCNIKGSRIQAPSISGATQQWANLFAAGQNGCK